MTSLVDSWSRREQCEPTFEFLPPPDLTRLRAALEQTAKAAAQLGPWGELLAERALELDSDARLAEHIGRSGFRDMAQQRYVRGESCVEREADRLARDWCRISRRDETEHWIAADDQSNPLSLINRLRAEMAERGVLLPIRVDKRLAAAAAVDRECIWIRGAERLTPTQSRRIAVHEIHGHVMRRVRAREPENAMSWAGFRSSDEDEEGRALWLEERSGLLDRIRRRELAWRHIAARACQRGATFTETANELMRIGCALEPALKISLRIWRGGGLARESFYLRSHVSVRDTLERSPATEEWMRRGRYSTYVAARLATGELAPPRLDLWCD